MKAIIIANEQELLKRTDERYAEIKEKLIGQTIAIKSTVEEAYAKFLNELKHENVRTFLENEQERVISIHKASGTGNLRLLKQALWDYERLAAAIPKEQWVNLDAMRLILDSALVVSIEHRAGRLLTEAQVISLFEGRLLRDMRRRMDEEKSVEDLIEERYPMVNFSEPVLASGLIKSAMFDGHVENSSVQQSLGQSQHFAKPSGRPLWLRAWEFFDLSDQEAQDVAVEFMSAFDHHEFKGEGEIFHAFGILLNYVDIGLIKKTKRQAVRLCKKYIDHLFSHEEIVFDPERPDLFGFGGSFAGHGFMARDTEEFSEVINHFENKYENLAKKKYPAIARALLDDLRSGGSEFFYDLCYNDIRRSRFSDRPILAAISPIEFVNQVISLDAESQRKVFKTLKNRHQFDTSDETLRLEKQWLKRIYNLFNKKIKRAPPLSAHRLCYLVDNYLKPVIASWESRNSPQCSD